MNSTRSEIDGHGFYGPRFTARMHRNSNIRAREVGGNNDVNKRETLNESTDWHIMGSTDSGGDGTADEYAVANSVPLGIGFGIYDVQPGNRRRNAPSSIRSSD